MRILIVGAGQVGKTVMRDLADQHHITLIDQESATLDGVPYSIDVYSGDGLDRDLLSEAGIEKTDVLVTTTSDDRTNLLICNTAKVMSDCYTVARVSDPSFVETWSRSEGVFGVDELVGRANLTAQEVVKLIGLQSSLESALDEESFSEGKVKLAEYRLKDHSPVAGNSLEELDYPGGVSIGAVIRNGDVEFGRGSLVLESGDKVTVIGAPDAVRKFGEQRVNPGEDTLHESIDILGGGDVGLRIAELLEGSGLSVRLFEQDTSRAEYLSDKLPNTLVLQADVTQCLIWEEEQIPDSEMVILSTGRDERNLLCTHIGLEHDVSRLVSMVHEQQYLGIFESLDLMRAVHPREVVASSITDFIQESYAETVTMIDHDKADVFEKTLSEDGLASDCTLEELRSNLSDPFVVGSIVRNGKVIPPGGSVTLRAGDDVIVLADKEHAEDIADQL